MRLFCLVGLAALAFVGGCGSALSVPCQLVLLAVPQPGQHVTRGGMRRAEAVVKRRLGELGVRSPAVRLKGRDEVVVDLAGARDSARAATVLSQQGELQFYDLEADLAPASLKNGRPRALPSLQALRRAAEKGAHRWSFVSCSVSNPDTSGCLGADGHSKTGIYWYAFKTRPELTPNDLVKSRISAGINPDIAQPELTLAFTPQGSRAFQAITKAEYIRGRRLARQAGVLNSTKPATVQRYVQHNAIVLDGVLESAPYIDYTDDILSRGISGGSAAITTFRQRAAQNLALILRSGPLPYPMHAVISNCSS